MLENKNINNLKSERLAYFPNVNFLMKISLGLIFFTMLSTVLVYAETITEDNPTIHIIENAYLQTNFAYLDDAMFSITVGTSITLVNNDIVSHKFISGDVIATDVIAPGESISIVINDSGQFKISDPDYPWIELDSVCFSTISNYL